MSMAMSVRNTANTVMKSAILSLAKGNSIRMASPITYPEEISLSTLRESSIAGRLEGRTPSCFFYLGFTIEEPYREQYREILKLFEGESRLARDKYNLYNYFTGIFSELTEDKPYQDILIRDYVEQILVLTYRNFLSERRKGYAPKPANKTGDEIVYEMVHYIDSNIFAIRSLESVGEAMGYSYSYLSRLFSQKMGRTLKEYFQERRFDRAVTLLQEGVSITDAAQMLGYDSIYSFSRAFKKQFGSSPTAMMRREDEDEDKEEGEGKSQR